MPEKKFQPPKGMRDIYPEEMALLQQAFSKIREIMRVYNFKEVEPTKVEMFETLAAKSGEEIEREIYAFEDKAGRRLGLRFDLTVGMARMVASSAYAKPIRWFCIADMFRYEAPQKGRYRAFWQWDAEIFGSKSIYADAECIALGCDILSAFGIDFEVRVSSRKLVEAIMREIGVPTNKLLDAFRCVDKLQKLSKDRLLEEFERRGIDKKMAASILDALNYRGDFKSVMEEVRNKFNSKEVKNALDELVELEKALRSFGIDDKCVLDLSIVRGLDYYTGIVFEAYTTNKKALGSALFGGGRYDGLVGTYGQEMPAVGLAGGMERLMEVLKAENKLPEVKEEVDYFVAYINERFIDRAAEVLARLRKKGFVCEMDIMNRNLSAQLRYASKINAKKVVIVGEKEIKEGKVTVRDMKSGEEKMISVDAL